MVLPQDFFNEDERRVPSVSLSGMPSLLDVKALRTSYLVPNFHLHLMPDQAVVSPPGDELFWNAPGTADYYRQQQTSGSHPNRFAKYPSKQAVRQMQFVNQSGRDIYSLIDGSRTGEEIYQAVLAKNNEPYGKFHDEIYGFFQNVVHYKHAFPAKEKTNAMYAFAGSEEFFVPIHAAVEITANCNARCKHCYGSFGHARQGMLSTDTTIGLLRKLRNDGVRTVEMTGGECSTHPGFATILEECVRLFDLVAILTNGIAIDDNVFRIAEENASKLFVQICINGRRDYHDDFVQFKGAFDRSSQNITRFAERGVLTRGAMNLTYENGQDIEFVLNHVMNFGASIFAPSWINMSQGRATTLHATEDEYSCLHCFQFAEQNARIEELEKKYPEYIRYRINDNAVEMANYDRSCGVGRRTVYVTSDGFFHLCPMAIGTNVPGYGTIESFLSGESPWDTPFSRKIYQLPMPSLSTCEKCDSLSTCLGCITRGIGEYLKSPAKCTWGKTNELPDLLKYASSYQ